MRAILQSWFGAVRGGVHPREVALAVFLGTVAGFTLGWNLTFVGTLLCVLLLRAPIKIALEAGVLGCALGWAFTPTVFNVGHYLLHRTSVGEWLAPRADNLWVVLLDLDRYVLMGGLAIGIGLGLVLAGCAARLTTWMQHRFATLKEKVQAHEAWKQKLWVRLCTWLIFGTPERAKQSPPATRFIRVSGVVVCLVVLVPLAGAGWYFIPRLSEKAILYGMSVANGAEVNADEVKLSLTDGMLYMKNVQIADPDDLYQDRLRIAHLNAVVNPGLLLRGHVEIEQVLLEGFAADLPREHRAEPYRPKLPGFDKAAGRLRLPAAEALKDVSLKDVLKQGKDVNSRLELAQKIIAKLEDLTGDGERERQKSARPYFLALRDAHCDFGNPRPTFAVRELRAADPAPQWGLGRSMSIQIANLSSDPKRLGKPTSVELIDPEAALVIAAEFDLHRKNGQHSVSLELRDREINSLLGEHALGQALAVESGRMTVLGEGSVSSREVDVTLAVSVQDVQIAAVGSQTVAGLPAETWSRGLSHVQDFQVVGHIYGPTQSPHVEIDADKLADEVKRHLAEFGEAALAGAAQKHLEVNETEAADLIAEAKRAAEALKTAEGREGLRTARKLDDIVPGIAAQIREELDKPRPPQAEDGNAIATPPATEAESPAQPKRRKRDRYTDNGFAEAEPAAETAAAAAEVVLQDTQPLPPDADQGQPMDRTTQAVVSPGTPRVAPPAEVIPEAAPTTGDVVWQATPPPSRYAPPVEPEAQTAPAAVETPAIANAPSEPARSEFPPAEPTRIAAASPAENRDVVHPAVREPSTNASKERRGPGETAALPPVGGFSQPAIPRTADMAQPIPNGVGQADVATSGGGYVRRLDSPPIRPAETQPGPAATQGRGASPSSVQTTGQRYVHQRTIGQRYADRYRSSGAALPAPGTAVANSSDEIIEVPPTYRGPNPAVPASSAVASASDVKVGDRYASQPAQQFAHNQYASRPVGPVAGPPGNSSYPRMASVAGARPGPPPVYATGPETHAAASGESFPPAPPIGRRDESAANPLGPPPGQAQRTPAVQQPRASQPPTAGQPAASSLGGQYVRQPAPPTAAQQPPTDEWRLARWTRTAGTTMKGWFSSEDEEAAQPPPQQAPPAQPPMTTAPPMQQPSAQPQMRIAGQPPVQGGTVAGTANAQGNFASASAPTSTAGPANPSPPAERQGLFQRLGGIFE